MALTMATAMCYVMRNFGAYVSSGATQKFMLHNSVGYCNTRSRDQITLLSMDIMVETFLEIGVSDLLVSTNICKTHCIWKYEKHTIP
jgi:hypothetical protein